METSVEIKSSRTELIRVYIVREELIPKLKPKLVAWLKDGYLAQLIDRYDVKGCIADATATMLEDMTNRVGAYHIGAIQVLGYIFGLLTDVLMVMTNSSNGKH